MGVTFTAEIHHIDACILQILNYRFYIYTCGVTAKVCSMHYISEQLRKLSSSSRTSMKVPHILYTCQILELLPYAYNPADLYQLTRTII